MNFLLPKKIKKIQKRIGLFKKISFTELFLYQKRYFELFNNSK